MKRIFAITALLVALGTIVYYALPPSEDGRRALDELSKSKTFSLGGVGYAGQITSDEVAFFRILQSRHSSRLLRALFERGTTEAKRYALCGLRYSDRSLFKRCAAEFSTQAVEINTMVGCMVEMVMPSQFVHQIQKGDSDKYIKNIERERWSSH